MQASGMHAFSANASASEMLCSSGHSLVTLEAAVCGNETRRSSRSHQLVLVGMLGGVSPATFSREKATMWLSSAVLIAYEKGDFFYSSQDSEVAGRTFEDYEEVWPLL